MNMRRSGGVAVVAPFPWFGGKSRAAPMIWSRLGADAPNYIEPFAGSLAVLLGRPGGAGKVETVNDLDGNLANFWRASTADPDALAAATDWPVNEADLHARHLWLVRTTADRTERLMGDPEWFDVRAAGWWVWGLCQWIGSGWCSGEGAWTADEEGRFVRGDSGMGVKRQRPHLGDPGMGVHRKHDGESRAALLAMFGALSERLRRVRVCCGEWDRVLGPSVTGATGHRWAVPCAIVLDPPYSDDAGRAGDLYARDCGEVARRVREWAIENGDNRHLRIALCGYEGEHAMPAGWTVEAWRSTGGYGLHGDGAGRENSRRERVWFSPHCLQPQGRKPLW